MAKQTAPRAPTPQELAQMNAIQSMQVRQSAIDMEQRIFSQSYAPPAGTGALGSVINIVPKNVGLVKKFTILVSGNIRQTGTETLNLTPFGPANFFSNILLTDLNNQPRIATTGWHLHLVSSERAHCAYTRHKVQMPSGRCNARLIVEIGQQNIAEKIRGTERR